MIEHQVFSLLRLLSSEELKSLDRCIQARFFYYEDDPKKVIELFDLIKKHAPDFNNQHALNYDGIAKKLRRSVRNISQLLSGLHTVVRNFINWTYLDDAQDKYYQNLGLLNFYNLKKQGEKFEALFEKMDQSLIDSSTNQNNEVAFQRFLIHYRKYDWMHTNRPSKDINLLNTLQHLESFYMIQKAQLIYHLLLRDRNTPINYKNYDSFEIQMDEYLFANPKGNELLQLYRLAILLLRNDEKVSIEYFRQELHEKKELLAIEDYQTLAGMERQILLEKILDGEHIRIPELFKVYKEHMEEGLIDREALQPSMFTNIVRYGCTCGELDWAVELLQEYRDKVSSNLYNLNYAYYLFHKGNLDDAKELIAYNFEEITRKIAAKSLELMILYEFRYPSIEYSIDAFRHLLKNAKDLPERRKNIYNNFRKYLQSLAKLNPAINKDTNLSNQSKYQSAIDELRKKINNNPTAEATWLLKKLDLLAESSNP